MPHRVDIDSVHKNVFVLLNICYAAKTFAQNHNLECDDDREIVNWSYYIGWLKFTLSENLIDVSIKTRIILDMVGVQEELYRADGEKYLVDSRAIDQDISSRYNIGFMTGGDKPLGIREACNKIIHASDISPSLEEGDEEHVLDEESENKREWRYWAGALNLSGQKGKDEWHLTLHVSDFCLALDEFLSRLEHEGVWQSIIDEDDYIL